MAKDSRNEFEIIASFKAKCLLVFPSVHQVMKAEKLLKGQDIKVDLIPMPREISSDCGVAIELSLTMKEEALRLLEKHQLSVYACYTKNHRTYEKGNQ
jgi:hypothetical protein